MTFVEYVESLLRGELPWEVWLWEMPADIERRTHGPIYYTVMSRHRSQNAAIKAKNSQPPAPHDNWYRVVDRRWPDLGDIWRERV